MLAELDATAAFAIAGFVTGVIALLWTMYRDVRQAARLRVSYYIYEEDTARHKGHKT